MPRSVDPANISVGTGLAAQDSIEANALVHPTGGNDGLRVHILDPSRAHMAAAVGVADPLALFTADEVEGALAELAGAGSSSRSNGVVEGGTFTSVGLTLTLATPTTLRRNGTDADYSGDSVVLNNNTTNYVYVDATTGVLATAGAPPALALEDILIAEVITVAGAVTASTDARFFILNLDRKPSFTIRNTGADGNRHSEGAFESIEAAFLWLRMYGGAGAQIRHTHLVMRGTETITSTLVIPAPVFGLTIEGDGLAGFVSGGVGLTLLDIAATSRLRLTNLTFLCNHTGCTAVASAVGGNSDFAVEKCQFLSGGSTWDRGISIVGAANRMVVRDCEIAANDYGIYVETPSRIDISHTAVTSPASLIPSTAIHLADPGVPPAGHGQCVIRNCQIDGYYVGIHTKGGSYAVADCDLINNVIGVFYDDPGPNVGGSIRNTRITLSAADGTNGIVCEVPEVKIEGCDVTNPRTVWAAATPAGISTVSADDVAISDCIVRGFFNTGITQGIGILLNGNRSTVNTSTVISARYGLSIGAFTGIRVSDCYILDVEVGVVSLATGAAFTNIQVIMSDPITAPAFLVGGDIGMDIGSAAPPTGDNTIITNCLIRILRANWPGAGTPYGILLRTVDDVRIDGCHIEGFNNTVAVSGNGVTAFPATHVDLSDTTFVGCYEGVIGTVGSSNVTVAHCRFRNIVTDAIACTDVSRVSVSDCRFEAWGGAAVSILECEDVEINGNQMNGAAVAPLFGVVMRGLPPVGDQVRRFTIEGNSIQQVTAAGIRLDGFVQDGTVADNQIDGMLSTAIPDPTAIGIELLVIPGGATVENVTITGNTVSRCAEGIVATGSLTDPVVNLVFNDNVVHHCATIATGTTFATLGTKGLAIAHGINTEICNNTIRDLGQVEDDAGVMLFPTAGPNTSSLGVVAFNCTQTTIDGNTMDDLRSTGPGGAAVGVLVTQFSSGVAPGTDFETHQHRVTNNNIRWNISPVLPGNGPGFNGISIDCNLGTDNVTSRHRMVQMDLTGNQVLNTLDVGLDVRADAYSALSQVHINRNHLTLLGTDGIRLQGGVVQHYSIDDNKLTDITDVGIRVDGTTAPATPSSFRLGSISRNQIWNTTNLSGILVFVDVAGLVFEDLAIDDNYILDPNTEGIRVEVALGTTMTTLDRVHIRRNTVRNAESGVWVYTYDQDIKYLTVSDNELTSLSRNGIDIRVRDVAAAGNMHVMADVQVCNNQIAWGTGFDALRLQADGIYDRILIKGNTAVPDSPPIVSGRPMRMLSQWVGVASGEIHSTIKILDNVFDGGEGSLIELFGDTAQAQFSRGPGLRDMLIDGNTFRNSAAGDDGLWMRLYPLDSAAFGVDGLAVSHNQFDNCDQTGLKIANGLDYSSQEGNAPSRNIVLNDNRFADAGTSGLAIALRYTACSQHHGFAVRDNEFSDIGDGTDSTNAAVMLEFGLNAGGEKDESIIVQGNTFTHVDGGAIWVTDNTVALGWELNSLSINGNTLSDGNSHGILVVLTAFTNPRAITINDNILQDLIPAAPASVNGIYLALPSGQNTEGVQICNNNLQTVDDHGIIVDANDELWSTNICGNTLGNIGADGIRVEVTTLATALQICGNTLFAVADHGIYLRGITSANFYGCRVAENTLQEAGTIDSLDAAIYVEAPTGDVDNMAIDNNTLQNCHGYGIELWVGGGNHNNSIDGNNIRDYGFNSPSIAVSGIRWHNDSAGGSQSRWCSISNNTLHIDDVGTQPLATSRGIDIYTETETKALDVSHNRVSMGNATQFGLFVEAAPAGLNLRGWVFEGNIIDDTVDAHTTAGHTWPPATSVAIGNISSDAATHWTAFAGGFTVFANNIDDAGF